ncbi:MAG: hypothetical protein ACK481_02675 [Candidatus Melainabacteria bacterium]|jgi:hypothetical protein
MDNASLSLSLLKIATHNRDLASDHLVKSTAPNASELCTGQLDFASAMKQIAKSKNPQSSINSILKDNTETVKVTKSTREAAVDLSQAYIVNSAMAKLLNHTYRLERIPLDNFKPAG